MTELPPKEGLRCQISRQSPIFNGSGDRRPPAARWHVRSAGVLRPRRRRPNMWTPAHVSKAPARQAVAGIVVGEKNRCVRISASSSDRSKVSALLDHEAGVGQHLAEHTASGAHDAAPWQQDGSDHRSRRRLRAPPSIRRYQSTGPFNKPTMIRMLKAQRAEECLQATKQ